MGMGIPEDLRLLACNEQEFKEHTFKKQHGIAEDNQSTLLLKEAIAAGQKTKAGIGFKSYRNDKKSNRNLSQYLDDTGDDLIGQYKEMIDTIKRKEFQIEDNELSGRDAGVYMVKKKVSKFTDAGEAPAEEEQYKEVKVSASEYQKEKLEEYKQNTKKLLQNKFRHSFVQGGVLTFNSKTTEEAEAAEVEGDEEKKKEKKGADVECLENIEDKFNAKDKFGDDPMYDDEN